MTRAVTVWDVDGTSAAVTGGHGRVRVWDLRTGATRASDCPGTPAAGCSDAVGEVDGAPVAVVGGVRAARVRDLRTGAARGEPLQGHTGRVDAVAAGEVDGPPVAVVGDSNGAISMWAIDRDQRAFAHLDAPQESLPLPLPTRLAGLPCREDHCTPITLFGASLTKSRQTGTGVQIGG